MSKYNLNSNSPEIFSARREKKQIANMKRRDVVFHILWSLSCFIPSNVSQATNTVLGAGEMETNKKWCCPAGLQCLVEETDVNTIAPEVDRCYERDGKGTVVETCARHRHWVHVSACCMSITGTDMWETLSDIS